MVLVLLTSYRIRVEIINQVADLPNPWKIADNFDIQFLKQFPISTTAALQNLRTTKCTTAQHDTFSCSDNSLLQLAAVGAISSRHVGYSDSFVAFEDDAVDARVCTLMCSI